MDQTPPSIFRRYYTDTPFIDRFIAEPRNAVDIIIPIIHTNELWRSNLASIYREIPVNRLLIGDGGCIDDSIKIVREFPRVTVYDHRNIKSLGFSIRKLIEEVETDWFLYLHSDVFLPDGWFEAMREHQQSYDWFECNQQITALIEYLNDIRKSKTGFGFGGSHMGRTAAFENAVTHIDDDYLYRNEDIILRTLVERAGYKCGQVGEIFHYHQVMHRQSAWTRKIKSVSFQLEMSREEEVRTNMMQVKGFVKYLDPTPVLVNVLQVNLFRLIELKEMDIREFKKWVKDTNVKWLPYILKRHLIKKKLTAFLKASYRLIFN